MLLVADQCFGVATHTFPQRQVLVLKKRYRIFWLAAAGAVLSPIAAMLSPATSIALILASWLTGALVFFSTKCPRCGVFLVGRQDKFGTGYSFPMSIPARCINCGGVLGARSRTSLTDHDDSDVQALLFDIYNRAVSAHMRSSDRFLDIEEQQAAIDALLSAAQYGERDPVVLSEAVRLALCSSTSRFD